MADQVMELTVNQIGYGSIYKDTWFGVGVIITFKSRLNYLSLVLLTINF